MSFEEFADLTPRQFHGLLKALTRQEAVDYFRRCTAFAAATGNTIKLSLEEYLELVFKEDAPESKFEDSTDKKLDEYAKKQLEEMQKQHGNRK